MFDALTLHSVGSLLRGGANPRKRTRQDKARDSELLAVLQSVLSQFAQAHAASPLASRKSEPSKHSTARVRQRRATRDDSILAALT